MLIQLKENEKLCDECGKNPPKVFVQLEGSYKLICSDCSRKTRHTEVEQWVDYEDADFIEVY